MTTSVSISGTVTDSKGAKAVWKVGPLTSPVIPPPVSGTFQGSPNATVTAINTAGGIVASRISGMVPFGVQMSASAILASGTAVGRAAILPYEQLEYIWNFGDPGGSQIFTHPVTGQPINANIQFGPEAAYIYETVGTKTITLSIRGQNGLGYTQATVTLNVTANARDVSGGEFWVDSAAAGGGSGTIGSPFNSIAQVNSHVASKTAFHFKRGSVFNVTTGINSNGWAAAAISGVLFDDYGTGAKPIINNSGTSAGTPFSGANACFYLDNSNNVTLDDFVVKNLEFTDSAGQVNGQLIALNAVNTSKLISNVVFYNVDVLETVNPASNLPVVVETWNAANLLLNCMWWGGSIVSPQAGGGNSQGFFGGAQIWNAIVGLTISGGGNDIVLDHHLYIEQSAHSLVRWVTFGSGPTKDYCLRCAFNGIGGTAPEITQYWLISENLFTGTQAGHTFDNNFHDITLERFQNCVVQQNAVANFVPASRGFHEVNICNTFTSRDNLMWGCNAGFAFFLPDCGSSGGPSSTITLPEIYRNKVYRTGGSASLAIISTQSDPTITKPWIVTDNTLWDTEVAALVFDPVISEFQSNGAIIDRNTYKVPNDTTYLGSTPVTFATWQAGGFDVNGTNSVTPAWNVPPTQASDFGPWPF